MKVFIPENLNLDSSKHADKYYYIISTLTYRMIFDKTFKQNSFIPARSKIWHDVINSRYKSRVNELIEMGVLEINNSYWSGEISKRYRLKKPYRKAKMKQVTIKDERIIKRAKKHRAKRIAEMTYPQHNYIYENLTKTEIDINEARKLLEETNFTETKKNYYLLMLDYFYEKNWFWKIGETGRIYNNATCLPKIFRGLLTYQNKRLVEVDVRTSQPFIMNLPIREYLALKISDIFF